jgi:hypothetical protein
MMEANRASESLFFEQNEITKMSDIVVFTAVTLGE